MSSVVKCVGIYGLNGWNIYDVNGWGSYGKVIKLLFFGRYVQKTLVFRGNTLSGPCMTTGFGPLELPFFLKEQLSAVYITL